MSEWFVMPPKKPNKFQINNIKSGITFSNWVYRNTYESVTIIKIFCGKSVRIYSVNHRFSSNTGKYGPGKTPNSDTFYPVVHTIHGIIVYSIFKHCKHSGFI